jgi:SrtB family sortase
MNENDELHNPQPHQAPARHTVSAVLDKLISAGDNLVTLLGGLLAALLILYSGYVIYDNYQIENQAISGAWDVLQFKPELFRDGQVSLQQPGVLEEMNQDYRAWLTVYETNIDYPVMQGPDDTYYASHDIYGEFSLSGAIYLSAWNTPDLKDPFNLIYGHHMDNGAMFGGLDDYLDSSYRDAHREGVLISPSGVYDLELFAVISTDAYEKMIYEPGPDRTAAEIIDFLTNPGQRADVHYYDAALGREATKITALSTCADATTNGRLVVFFITTQRNLLTVEIPSYSGVYDAREHTVEAVTNYPEGTTIAYSLDGGSTWSTSLPSIRNVGTMEVLVRAVNDIYGVAAATATLTVTPAPAVVTAADSSKVYGDPDPVFTASVSGVIDNFQLQYTVARTGGNEAPGFYPDVIVPSGAAIQGNYTVSYVPGNFSITVGEGLSLAAVGYEGVYDGNFHEPSAAVNITDGTVLLYSTDNGATWSFTPPSIRDAGFVTVLIQASNSNYETVTVKVTLNVKPRPVTVIAKDAEKQFGAEDPQFTATVTGLLDDDQVVYTVSRPGVGKDEAVGTYHDAIVPAGEALQGNYVVSYLPANFTITESTAPKEPTDPTVPTEPRGPEDGPVRKDTKPFFSPEGQSLSVWAILNLICLLYTLYNLFPLLHLRDKYGRTRLLRQAARPADRVNTFRRKLRIGVILEAVAAVAAIIVFILTQDLRLPMVLIDRWTPIMLGISLIAWVADLCLVRYREKEQAGIAQPPEASVPVEV